MIKKFTLKCECGRQSPAVSLAVSLANGVKLLVLLYILEGCRS